jgi:hypothetical protein
MNILQSTDPSKAHGTAVCVVYEQREHIGWHSSCREVYERSDEEGWTDGVYSYLWVQAPMKRAFRIAS